MINHNGSYYVEYEVGDLVKVADLTAEIIEVNEHSSLSYMVKYLDGASIGKRGQRHSLELSPWSNSRENQLICEAILCNKRNIR